MSHISVRGEQSTSAEIETLTGLNNLPVSGPGEFIRKTGADTFENATPAGSGGTTQYFETPLGDTDGVNTSYTVTHPPFYILGDGIAKYEGLNYTYLAGTITWTDGAPPTTSIRSIYQA